MCLFLKLNNVIENFVTYSDKARTLSDGEFRSCEIFQDYSISL